MATLSATIFEIATGIPAVATINKTLYIVYAAVYIPMPSAPKINLLKGILYIAPLNLTSMPAIAIISAP